MQIRELLPFLVGLGNSITEAACRIKQAKVITAQYFTRVSALCQWCCSTFITLYWHEAIHSQANGSFPGVLIQAPDEK